MGDRLHGNYINPLTVSVGYVVLSSLWILISDHVTFQFSVGTFQPAFLQHIKGLLFVLVTGLLLFFLMNKYRRKFVKKNEEIAALSKEVHHRVKNNLALITSLLELERENRDFDPEYEDLLIHTNFKIKTIAVIHDLLYQQDAFSKIDLNQFLKEFKKRVVFPLYNSQDVKVDLKFDNKHTIQVDIKYAIPIALFLYECVVYMNRYLAGRVKQLFIDVYKTKYSLYLSCHFRTDDSVPEIDIESPTKLELQLVEALLQQMEAYWKVEYDQSEAVIYVDVPLEREDK